MFILFEKKKRAKMYLYHQKIILKNDITINIFLIKNILKI